MSTLFQGASRSRVATLCELAYCNPFTAQRVKLEREILGPGAVPRTVWSRHGSIYEDDPIVAGIDAVSEPLAEEARRKLVQSGRTPPSAEEQRLYEGLVLYVVYQRYRNVFFEEIISQEKRKGPWCEYDRFVEDVRFFTDLPGIRSWVPLAPHLFALFYQMRRGFHFIFLNIIGQSAATATLREGVWQSIFTHSLRRFRDKLFCLMHEMPTLIVGPSGTGKELVASAIAHSAYIPFDPASRRFTGDFRDSFHPLNLAALSPTLIEAELFGYKRGAFTGATTDRQGHFEGKNSTQTIFLDEIGELNGDIQVKLLRVLQSRDFQRLGDVTVRKFGGKVVSATHRNLAEAIRCGRFREDLYYRLCADIVETPPLASQLDGSRDELKHLVGMVLARMFAEPEPDLAESVTDGIVDAVGLDYRWPGNVRELEQCVRNLLIRQRYQPPRRAVSIGSDEMAPALTAFRDQVLQGTIGVDELLAKYYAIVYAHTGSFSEAGDRIGVDRRTVSSRIDRTFLAALE